MKRDEDFAFEKAAKRKKPIPFDFILDELADLLPVVKPMFGCHGIYLGEKIIFVVRERETALEDNGVWLATTIEHHESLRKDFPIMRSIGIFETPVTGWQVLPADAPEFEKLVLKACALVRKKDNRIGRVPTPKKKKSKIKGRSKKR